MSSSSSLDPKKKMIYGAVIGVCIAGGALAYFLQRPADESKTPAGKEAAVKSDAIQKAMEEEAAKSAAKNPPPKDFERKVTKGAVVPPK